MRLFFHLVDRTQFVRDQEGVETDDLSLARSEALKAIEELRQGDEASAIDWSGWSLAVTDATGEVLLSIDLDDHRTRNQ